MVDATPEVGIPPDSDEVPGPTDSSGADRIASDRWDTEPRKGIKRHLPRSLFGRTLMIIVVPAILMQAIATFIFYDRHWDTMSRRLASAVAGDMAMVIGEMAGRDTVQRWVLFNRAAGATSMIFTFLPDEILTPAGTDIGYPTIHRHLKAAMDERLTLPHALQPQTDQNWVSIQVQLGSGVLQARIPAKRLSSTTTTIFILWMIGSGVVLFTISLLFMRNQIRPIGRLARAADRFGKGQEVANFKLEGALEVRRAARAFLIMRQRIQRQINQRTDMLAGVSHDLRTPLTRMKLELEMLGGGPEIDELRADVDEMERMIEGYLAFARGEGTEEPQTLEIVPFVEEIVAAALREGANAKLDIHETRSEKSAHFVVRPQALRRAIANLLSNARRHAHLIWVEMTIEPERVVLTIDDDGPGIAKNMLEDVFRPFYRIDASRNSQTGGTGLGLSIARDVIRGHGGDLTLGRSLQGGLRCQIRLPR